MDASLRWHDKVDVLLPRGREIFPRPPSAPRAGGRGVYRLLLVGAWKSGSFVLTQEMKFAISGCARSAAADE